MTAIGPVQLLAIGFGPDAEYKGQILDELEKLEGNGLIRVLDLLFVGQDLDSGELVALDYQGDDLGALVGSILGFAFTGGETDVEVVDATSAGLGRESFGLSRPQIEDVIRRTPPDVAIGMLLIEHVWARDLKRAFAEAGGVPLAEGFLSDAVLTEIAIELEAVVGILEELEAETASEPAAAG